MAVVREFTDKAEWDKWVAERPEAVQKMCRSHPPDRLYRMASTGHRCTILYYSEEGTVRVDISGMYNRVVFGRQVFGVEIGDLTECDLPGPDEDVGDTSREAGYTDHDIKNILIPKLLGKKNKSPESGTSRPYPER
jgi:hypothetical protein